MKERVKKPLTVALAAVLVLMALFPVPVGARSLDRARFQEANANPALAAPLIIGTALAACGVYVAGYDIAAYSSNRETISGQFVQFCADNLYHEDIDAATAAIQSAVTPGGAVDMGVLSSLGILGLIPAFSEGLISSNQAVNGVSSLESMQGVLNIGNHQFAYASGIPAVVATHSSEQLAQAQANGYADLVAMSVATEKNGNVTYQLYFTDASTMTASLYETTSGGADYSQLRLKFYGQVVTLTCLNTGAYSSGITNVTTRNTISVCLNGVRDLSAASTVDRFWYVYQGIEYPVTGYDVSNGMVSRATAVVNGEIAANTAAYPTSQVQPFEPTAEQLAAGYDTSSILDAINSNTGTVEGIAAQLGTLAGLLSPVAGIAANVQSIKDAWTNTSTAQTTPFPWLDALWDSLFGILGATPLPDLLSPITLGVQAVQSWIGDTPFPTIMQTVIDGVQAIPDGIRNLGQDLTGSLEGLLDGVLSIPGTLEGVLDGVLEGVQAIPGSIEQVIEAVQAGVVDLTGALDAVMHPQLPQFEPPSGSIAVPPGTLQAAEFDIKDKVPFCYVIRARDALGSMFANFNGNRSFYFDLDIPNAGTVTFDGEVVLSQNMGGLDIATTIRVLATGLLCLGLLYRAYKVVERSSGSI